MKPKFSPLITNCYWIFYSRSNVDL